ncbi:MAG: hypothetical protein DRJ61_08425 [Acidobacteria bacterium]|nr:MAG: hypothetical protein DRJ65_07440 [Acidobacteriota bacterium]RLE32908.1 MAG: hypothetical protein DRJ61_08425 [Acidobacteriota bacterium]
MRLRKLVLSIGKVVVNVICCTAMVTVSTHVVLQGSVASANVQGGTFSIPKYQTGLKLSWQASVGISSGRFVVYWGFDDDHLFVVSEVVASEGDNEYYFYDLTAHAPYGRYRLAFRDISGQETILVEAMVTADDNIKPDGVGTTSTNPQPVTQGPALDMEPQQTEVLFKRMPTTWQPGAGPSSPDPPP